jgi:GcrA cell cycle regulator
MSGKSWTPAEDAVVEARWAAGDSAGAIAHKLGRSRNSIIGRVHRLDLPGRPSPISNAPPPKPRPAYQPRQTLPSLAAPAPEVPKAGRQPRGPATKPYMPKRRCEWIDGVRGAYDRCCEPVARGAFCQRHGEIAYERPVAAVTVAPWMR